MRPADPSLHIERDQPPLKMSLAGRAGRWSVRHRTTAIVGWLGFVVATFALGSAIGTKQLPPSDPGPGDSGRAEQILNTSGFTPTTAETVLVQRNSATGDGSAFRSALRAVAGGLSGIPVVKNLRSPLDDPGQTALGGRAALVQFEIKGDVEKAAREIPPVLAAVRRAQTANPRFTITEIGDASVTRVWNGSIRSDFHRAELLSIPITLLILLAAFGTFVAASVPLLLGLTAVLAALGLFAIASHIWPDSQSQSVILLIGLAVGVDYALFYLTRERQERDKGFGLDAALQAAAATSGRSVLASGVGVLIAMTGMFLTGDKVFSSIAVGTILVVMIAMLGSLTVLPALLSKLGDRVEKGRLPLSRSGRGGQGRFWSVVVDRVLRRPALSAALAASVLLAATIPAFGMRTTLPGFDSLPRGFPITKTYDRVQAAFPGGSNPAEVVVTSPNVGAPSVKQQIERLRRMALAGGQAHNPISVASNAAHTVARISMPIAGTGTNAVSGHAVAALRSRLIPATLGSLPGVHAYVAGQTAESIDFSSNMKEHAPIVLAFVLPLGFVLLLLTFRSFAVAAKAIVLNLLSVGAACGLLVLVFQHGIGRQLVGQRQSTGIIAWLPVFLFVVLFGLSMDYHVFILSRVREAVDRGASTEDAVRHGVRATAGVVTSAAAVMAAVFGVFATLSVIDLKQLGVALSSAIIIDATLVRGVLLPALMKLLGEWNWYLPRWLAWLPTLTVAENQEQGSTSASRRTPGDQCSSAPAPVRHVLANPRRPAQAGLTSGRRTE